MIAAYAELEDTIIRSLGVPRTLLEGDTAYSSYSADLNQFLAEQQKSAQAIADQFSQTIGRWAYFELILWPLSLQFRRNRCWWHCKKWERRKNGRRPIKREE